MRSSPPKGAAGAEKDGCASCPARISSRRGKRLPLRAAPPQIDLNHRDAHVC
jgi:hypothetical protein